MSTQNPVVTFFPSSAPAAVASCAPGGDTSCCGPATVSMGAPGDTVESLADSVSSHFEGKVDVVVASYQSEADVGSAIAGLNAVLTASGKKFEVTPVNFYTFVESVGPVVAVGDQILCTRRLPDWDELRDAVSDRIASAQPSPSGAAAGR